MSVEIVVVVDSMSEFSGVEQDFSDKVSIKMNYTFHKLVFDALLLYWIVVRVYFRIHALSGLSARRQANNF